MDNTMKHKWSDPELKVVCSICQLTENNEDRIRMLQLIFPDYSMLSIETIVIKYNYLFNNKSSRCCCIII